MSARLQMSTVERQKDLSYIFVEGFMRSAETTQKTGGSAYYEYA